MTGFISIFRTFIIIIIQATFRFVFTFWVRISHLPDGMAIQQATPPLVAWTWRGDSAQRAEGCALKLRCYWKINRVRLMIQLRGIQPISFRGSLSPRVQSVALNLWFISLPSWRCRRATKVGWKRHWRTRCASALPPRTESATRLGAPRTRDALVG